MRQNKKTFTLAVVFLCSLVSLPAFAQRGARTAPSSLDVLTRESDLIVRGSVISARVEPHPQFSNLTTVLVTMRVEKTLKGTAAREFQFRQYIWDLRDKIDGGGYRKGQHLLLLLGPTSKYGLRSPSGLGQGRFTITKDSSGRELATNANGNVALFELGPRTAALKTTPLAASTSRLIQQKPRGPIHLDELEVAIRNFSGVTP